MVGDANMKNQCLKFQTGLNLLLSNSKFIIHEPKDNDTSQCMQTDNTTKMLWSHDRVP